MSLFADDVLLQDNETRLVTLLSLDGQTVIAAEHEYQNANP